PADPGTHVLSSIPKTGFRLVSPILRNSKGDAMRYVCLFALMAPVLFAQDGAAIYKERCASCHDAPKGRVPALAAIKAMSGEAIYRALTSGVMKTQAQGLSTTEIFALIGYIAPTGSSRAATPIFTRTCKDDAPFRPGAESGQWNGWSPSLTNSRFEDAASARLAVPDLIKLKPKWSFTLGDVT